ncbi:hypothetical protein [Nocardioides sp. SYSU D00038]|uniref:hypothetical protein n=1 Tax=Nocardioides sp. SYSU D00038 TaxID=2812554 RepID=UPI001967CDE9|nr:hypothetical protein [Nocardioides sp. SYSU D00038]
MGYTDDRVRRLTIALGVAGALGLTVLVLALAAVQRTGDLVTADVVVGSTGAVVLLATGAAIAVVRRRLPVGRRVASGAGALTSLGGLLLAASPLGLLMVLVGLGVLALALLADEPQEG